MRLKTNEDKINMPLRVIEPAHVKSQVGVKGVNLLNGETVTVFLTTKGKAAENDNRPDIEQLFKGIEDNNDELRQLKPGGIVMMNGAFKKRKDTFIAQWPYVVKYDDKDTSLLCEHGALISHEREDGGTAADFYSFHSEQSITASKADKSLGKKIAQSAIETIRPAYLVRVVDDAKQLVDYELHLSVYDSDLQQPLTPKQIAAGVVETASELLEQHPGRQLDILPASRFFIPAKNWTKREKYYTGLQRWFEKQNGGGEVEYSSRQALIKCGGDNDQYCNQVNVTQPYKSGADPVLIGGYRHAREPNDTEADRQITTGRPR